MSDQTNGKIILEEALLNKLINDASFFGAAHGYLKKNYFTDIGNALIFDAMSQFTHEYHRKPTPADIAVILKASPREQMPIIKEALTKVLKPQDFVTHGLLMKQTESFIKNAIRTEGLIIGAEGMQSNDESKRLESFKLLEMAEKVSLNVDLGMSYDDIDERIEYYQDDTIRLKTGIESFDRMLGRGIYKKSLTVVNAPQGVGKSATLSAWAVQFAKQGRDVVVFSLEMRPEEWLQRIDSNSLDIPIYQLATIEPQLIRNKYSEFRKDCNAKIYVAEYPGMSLTANMINSHLDKLMDKHDIKDPVLIVDYLGIMKANVPTGSKYDDFANIAVELRAIGQMRNIEVITAAQMNRSAFGNLEASNEAIADSVGIGNAADCMIIVNQTEQMKEVGEYKVSFAKNRFSGNTSSFKIGFDFTKFRFEDRFLGKSQTPSNDISTSLIAADPLDDLFKL